MKKTTSINTPSDNASSIVLWLLARSGEEERAWLIQPHAGPLDNLSPSSEAWQVPMTTNGLQRLANKWQQNGKPTLALKLAPANMSELTERDNPTLPRWQVCAVGTTAQGVFLPATKRDLGEIALLEKAGMRPMPVIDIAASVFEISGPSGSSKQEQKPDQPQLAHMLLLHKGRPALNRRFFSLRDGLPSPPDFVLALVVSSACAAISFLPSETALRQLIPSDSTAGTASPDKQQRKQLEQRLLETCTLPQSGHHAAASSDSEGVVR